MARKINYKIPRSQRREVLQNALISIIGNKAKVHYEPPENVKLDYPCILFFRDRIIVEKADNKSYITKTRYKITYIDNDPDSENIDKILSSIRGVTYGDHYVADGLHHDVFYTNEY